MGRMGASGGDGAGSKVLEGSCGGGAGLCGVEVQGKHLGHSGGCVGAVQCCGAAPTCPALALPHAEPRAQLEQVLRHRLPCAPVPTQGCRDSWGHIQHPS